MGSGNGVAGTIMAIENYIPGKIAQYSLKKFKLCCVVLCCVVFVLYKIVFKHYLIKH